MRASLPADIAGAQVSFGSVLRLICSARPTRRIVDLPTVRIASSDCPHAVDIAAYSERSMREVCTSAGNILLLQYDMSLEWRRGWDSTHRARSLTLSFHILVYFSRRAGTKSGTCWYKKV